MGTRTIGIVIEGATGRLGTTQHLRSLMAIRSAGGLALANGDRVPVPFCSDEIRKSSPRWRTPRAG